MTGILTLIPTPLDDDSPLEHKAFHLLQTACEDLTNNLILVEDHKPARRRWLGFGLPREAISHFILFNEHTVAELNQRMIAELKSGKNIFLMSDGGMPAFCDPGQGLVDLCHKNNLKVTSSPVPNSIILSVALSGLKHDSFTFLGFVPKKQDLKIQFYRRLSSLRESAILMDTPYHLEKVLQEISDCFRQNQTPNRELFIGVNLNMEGELVMRGKIEHLLAKLIGIKGEFIIVVAPI